MTVAPHRPWAAATAPLILPLRLSPGFLSLCRLRLNGCPKTWAANPRRVGVVRSYGPAVADRIHRRSEWAGYPMTATCAKEER
jgi:hypothetical protein